jgi:hypothetical protein
MKKFYKNKDKNKKITSRRRAQGASTPGASLSTNKYYRPKNTPTSAQSRISPVQSTGKLTLAKVINTGIGFAVLVGIFFASTLSAVPSISIKNSAPTYRDNSAYSDFATKYMKSSILSRSKVLFGSTDFEQAMSQEFPEIDHISAVIPLGGRKLNVNISLSVPLAIVMNGSQEGVVDSSGRLVTRDINSLTLDTSGNSLPKLRFSSPLDTFSAGTVLLTTTEIELLQLIMSELQNSDIMIAGAAKPLQVSEFLFNVSDGQLEVRFTGNPFYVKYSIYSDVRVQVGTMLQAFRLLGREGQPPTSYIDVRVPEKVYIK